MRLHKRVMDLFVSVLDEAGRRNTPVVGGLETIRSVGNILYCASLFSFNEVPHTFLSRNPAFVGKESLLGADFELPDSYVYIEDAVSGVAFVDLTKGQRGVGGDRFFVFIDQANAETIASAVNFPECFAALVEDPEAFDGTISIHTGTISRMDPMSPTDRSDTPYTVQMGVHAMMVISPSGRIAVCSDPFGPRTGDRMTSKCGYSIAEAERMAVLVAGNVRCGLRELAYYQASKADPGCRVTLVRAGQ